MPNMASVLTRAQLAEVHQRSLKILAATGVRVENKEVRKLLKNNGADVSEGTGLVKMPQKMVDEALALTSKRVTLGGRRPGWSFTPGVDECALCLSGEAILYSDSVSSYPVDGSNQALMGITRIGEVHDEVAIFWRTITPLDRGQTMADYIDYLVAVMNNFTKHIQDPFHHREQGPFVLEVLEAVYGGREAVRKLKPYSTLFCPQSPLVLKDEELASVLSLSGWDIPVCIMPMALMGGTAPASLFGILVEVNVEILATIVILQFDEPGRPVIYAPSLTLIEPRTGQYFAGGVEQSLMNGAAAQMAQFYGLPNMITGLESDAWQPGLQAAEDKALTSVLSFLCGVDIYIGPGLLGGDMVLNLEQAIMDIETFRKLKRIRRGFDPDSWLDDVLAEIGPGGNFLSHPSTVKNIRKAWYTPKLGRHGSMEKWFEPGAKDIHQMARDEVDKILGSFTEIPLEDKLMHELGRIREKAAAVEGLFSFV